MNIKNNKKSQQSKQKIKDALSTLIKDKEYQVSVKYLCEVAKINRTTFYSHFDSVEEVLYDMCGSYIKKAYNLTSKTNNAIKHGREPEHPSKENKQTASMKNGPYH